MQITTRHFCGKPLKTGLVRLGIPAVAALFLASCAPMPTGPTVAVMPAPNKPFDVFMQEEQLCRSWAAHSIGLEGHDAAADSLLRSSIAGAAIGAIAGAIVGGDHNVGAGAAMGTVIGATAGANQGNLGAWNAQRRYDLAYQQCMYSKGNVIPSPDYGGYRYPPPAGPHR